MGLGLGIWGLKHHLADANNVHLGLSVSGFLLAAGLIAYETWFLGKKGPLSLSGSEDPKSS